MSTSFGHPIYLHGLQFHSTNECVVQLLGGRIDEMRDGPRAASLRLLVSRRHENAGLV
jgi:hypothetical protein